MTTSTSPTSLFDVLFLSTRSSITTWNYDLESSPITIGVSFGERGFDWTPENRGVVAFCYRSKTTGEQVGEAVFVGRVSIDPKTGEFFFITTDLHGAYEGGRSKSLREIVVALVETATGMRVS